MTLGSIYLWALLFSPGNYNFTISLQLSVIRGWYTRHDLGRWTEALLFHYTSTYNTINYFTFITTITSQQYTDNVHNSGLFCDRFGSLWPKYFENGSIRKGQNDCSLLCQQQLAAGSCPALLESSQYLLGLILRTILILSWHLRLSLTSRLLHSEIPIKIVYSFLIFRKRSICRSYLFHFYFIARTIFGKK